MKTRTKLVVPQISAQADELIALIAELQKGEIKHILAVNEQIKHIRIRAKKKIERNRTKIAKAVFLIYDYYKANKKELTLGGKIKVVKLINGIFREYFTEKTVKVVGEEAAAVNALEKAGLGNLVRTLKEVNKSAVKLNARRVAGIKEIRIIGRKKKFMVKPNETSLQADIDID